MEISWQSYPLFTFRQDWLLQFPNEPIKIKLKKPKIVWTLRDLIQFINYFWYTDLKPHHQTKKKKRFFFPLLSFNMQ